MMSQIPVDAHGNETHTQECWIKLKNLFAVNADGTQKIEPSDETTKIIDKLNIATEIENGSLIKFSFLPGTTIDPHVVGQLIGPITHHLDNQTQTHKTFGDIAVINVESRYIDREKGVIVNWTPEEVKNKFHNLEQQFKDATPYSRTVDATESLMHLARNRYETCFSFTKPNDDFTTAEKKLAA